MTLFTWLFLLGLKGLVFAAAGMLAWWLMRNRSAAHRHLALTSTVVGLILIPALAFVPSPFELPLPTAFSNADETEADPLEDKAANAMRPANVSHSTNRETDVPRTPTGEHESPVMQEVDWQTQWFESTDSSASGEEQDFTVDVAEFDTADIEGTEPTPEATAQVDSFNWLAPAIVVMWSVGMLVALTIPIVGLLGIRWTRARSSLPSDANWRELLNALCRMLGIRRHVDLRTSVAVSSPITWGMIRPIILLPAHSNQWPAKQQQIVLQHELAHIRRHDWATQMLASCCCALHWFNPLVWWISRRMRVERELACDDLVLSSGTEPTRYAETLVQLAGRFHRRRSLAAIPMADQSRLEQRMRAILDKNRRREPASRPLIAGAITMCGAVLVPLALVGATGKPDAGEGTSACESAVGGKTEEPQPPAEIKPGMERIRIINGDNGKPIPGATVTFDPKVDPRAVAESDPFTAVAQTNGRGEVDLPKDTLGYLKFRVDHPKFLRGNFARTGAMIPGWTLYKSDWPYGEIKGQQVLKLWPGETIQGTVKHADGNPARGFEFQIASPSTDFGWYRSVVEPAEAARWGPDESRPAVRWGCTVKTDDSGRFSIAVPPRAKRQELRAIGSSKAVAPFDRVIDVGSADIVLERGTIVSGIYRKLDGSSAAKTSVTLYPVLPNGKLAGAGRHRIATTDAEGRFSLAPAASGPHVLVPYQGDPERLNLKAGERKFQINVNEAPYHDVTFDFENTLGSFSGNFNFWLRGDIQPNGGGDPIEWSAVTFKDGEKVTFRVNQAMQNAKLHFMNWPTQSVRIVEESGKVILPSEDAKPIDIPDLLNPPKLKIHMGKAARFYVNVVEADGNLAKDIEVTCTATGKDGKRNVGAFRRSGNAWERGGLFEGERVTVTVRRGKWSVTSKPSKPIKVEANAPSNKIEIKLPPMTVSVGEPRDGVFFGYTGYMTYVIELKQGRFRYWFESDAKSAREPQYPLQGKFTVAGDTVTLHHEQLIPLTSIWKCRSVNGIPTLWRSDALAQHEEKPTQLSVEHLRRWGSGSILAFTSKSAESMWQNRTAPTITESPARKPDVKKRETTDQWKKGALEKIVQLKPLFGPEKDGLKLGIAYTGSERSFPEYVRGDRIGIELFLMNVGEKETSIQLKRDPTLAYVPRVVNERREVVRGIDAQQPDQSSVRVTLRPGEACRVPTAGLGMGDSQRFANIESPVGGVFKLSYQVESLKSGTLGFKVWTDHLLKLQVRVFGDYFAGISSPERLRILKPVFGKARRGIEVGIAYSTLKRDFSIGEVIPMDMFFRNAGREEVSFEYVEDFFWNRPLVVSSRGKEVPITRVHAWISPGPHKVTLKPGEVWGLHTRGLALGHRVTGNIHEDDTPQPVFESPVAGEYELKFKETISNSGGAPGEWSDELTSGKLKFTISKDKAGNIRAKLLSAVNKVRREDFQMSTWDKYRALHWKLFRAEGMNAPRDSDKRKVFVDESGTALPLEAAFLDAVESIDDEPRCRYMDAMQLLSPADAMAWHANMVGSADDDHPYAEGDVSVGYVQTDKAWNRGWIPIATDHHTAFYFIDLAPGPEGTVGQIVYCDGQECMLRVVAKSFDSFLAKLIAILETDNFEDDETSGPNSLDYGVTLDGIELPNNASTHS